MLAEDHTSTGRRSRTVGQTGYKKPTNSPKELVVYALKLTEEHAWRILYVRRDRLVRCW